MKWIWLLLIVCGCDTVVSQLVGVAPEPPGANCPAGGTAVSIGLDANDNGQLDPSEVDSVQYVCNGPDGGNGSNGVAVLVETQVEPPGAHCAAGGIEIVTGLDANADGVLDASEVQHTLFVCNGTDGLSTLVVTKPEPPGFNCSLGGVEVLVGTDSDNDGVLDPEEVTSKSFVCDGTTADPSVRTGNVLITNTLDILLLAGVNTVDGSLGVLPSTSLDSITLPDLQHVGGLDNGRTRDFHLPALLTVAGDVELVGLETLDVPLLETVGGNFVFSGFAAPATELHLPALTTIGGDFGLESPVQLSILDTPLLQRVGGLVRFENLAAQQVSLPALASAGSLVFRDMTSLSSIQLDALQTVGNIDLHVVVLSDLEMPALTSIDGPVIVHAPQLPECEVTAILAQASYTGPADIQAAPCP